jgi:TPP-dependent pyruvate/acetoin dehydrogenase alpha subunit
VLFLCENNLYAMGTALARHQAQTDIALKAAGYGVKAETVDGMDVLAVEAATRRAVDAVRESSEPILIEYRTYRFRAHSMYDAELYRGKEEVEQWKKHCPIAALTEGLRNASGLTEADLEAIESPVAEEVEDAVAFAEAGAWEPVEDLLKDVYTQAKEAS